jgi:hypothetical protein
MMGVTTTPVYAWWAGKRRFSPDDRETYAAVTGKDIWWFYRFDDKQTMPEPVRLEVQPGMHAIYLLSDPDGTPRYIGRTSSPRARLQGHLSGREKASAKQDWIEALKASGQRPVMTMLAMVPAPDAGLAELIWMGKFASEGHPLVNSEKDLRFVRNLGDRTSDPSFVWGESQ